jgi:hypothetical protein
MLRLFDLGVICYKIKNGRHFLVWLATWGGSLPGQLSYSCYTEKKLVVRCSVNIAVLAYLFGMFGS